MTPLWLSSLLPVAELGSFFFLRHRGFIRRFPVLMTYLPTEAGWHLAACLDYQIATRWAMPFRTGMRALLVLEAFRLACRVLGSRRRWVVLAVALGVAGTMAGLTAMLTGLSPIESLIAFREYAHLILAGAMWALCLGAGRPRLEIVSRERSVYRAGVCAMLTVHALTGTFVHHGLGYLLLPYTQATYDRVAIGGYAGLLLSVVWLAWRLGEVREREAVARFGDPVRRCFEVVRRVA